MNSFITFEKNDPKALEYLRGSEDPLRIAIPVKGFRNSLQSDFFTFQMLDRSQVNAPSGFTVFLQAIRMDLCGLALGPWALAALYLLFQEPRIDWLWLVGTGLLLMGLQSVAFLLNDISDHMRGLDWSSGQRGSQVLQKGWLKLIELEKLSKIILAGSLLVGATLAVEHPLRGWVLGILALLLVSTFSFRKRGLKYLGLGDALIFLGFGPLLMLGMFSKMEAWPWAFAVLIGSLCGWLAVLVFQLRQLETLFADGVIKTGTFISRLGFDRSQFFIQTEIVLFLLSCAFAFDILYGPGLTALAMLALLPPFYLVARRLRQAPSPLSSSLKNIGRRGVGLHIYFIVVVFALMWIEHLWIQS